MNKTRIFKKILGWVLLIHIPSSCMMGIALLDDSKPSLLTAYLVGLLTVGMVCIVLGLLAIIEWLLKD